MTFSELHDQTQQEIREIEARKHKELAARNERIVGFADPVHDAVFKLLVLGVRLLKTLN